MTDLTVLMGGNETKNYLSLQILIKATQFNSTVCTLIIMQTSNTTMMNKLNSYV